jgi:threonine 3-dehydrogenase
VEVFSAALKDGHYNCFVAADTALPMMYMPDCLAATWQLMSAPKESLRQTTYNVTAVTFTPAELADAIQ